MLFNRAIIFYDILVNILFLRDIKVSSLECYGRVITSNKTTIFTLTCSPFKSTIILILYTDENQNCFPIDLVLKTAKKRLMKVMYI